MEPTLITVKAQASDLPSILDESTRINASKKFSNRSNTSVPFIAALVSSFAQRCLPVMQMSHPNHVCNKTT
jgi:hypothetical protein